jgi:hypothetical protein
VESEKPDFVWKINHLLTIRPLLTMLGDKESTDLEAQMWVALLASVCVVFVLSNAMVFGADPRPE